MKIFKLKKTGTKIQHNLPINSLADLKEIAKIIGKPILLIEDYKVEELIKDPTDRPTAIGDMYFCIDAESCYSFFDTKKK